MLAVSCNRLPYFSTRFQSHQGNNGLLVHGETDCSPWEECPTEMVGVYGLRGPTVAGYFPSIGGAGNGDDPPAGSTLEAWISGETELAWKENATLYAIASYQPDDDPCALCTYSWFQREGGVGSWDDINVHTETYYMTMLWTQGVEFKIEVDDGMSMEEGTHFIDYCSSGCGGPGGPKRGDILADGSAPEDYVLFNAYPNPFNPSTVISFSLPDATLVEISIYDLMGRKIETIVNDRFEKGYNEVQWNAPANLSSGIYLFRLITGGEYFSGQLILLK